MPFNHSLAAAPVPIPPVGSVRRFRLFTESASAVVRCRVVSHGGLFSDSFVVEPVEPCSLDGELFEVGPEDAVIGFSSLIAAVRRFFDRRATRARLFRLCAR